MATQIFGEQIFGERVRIARHDNKLTLEQAAKKIGFTKQSLYSIEKGRTRNTAHARAIATTFDVSFEWLLLGTGPMRKTVLPDIENENLVNMVNALYESVQLLTKKVATLEKTTYFGDVQA